MSELPDDMTQWPVDPYRLFQLPRTADAKQIRRVYAKLIRRFQPEFHPEHFRRIRSAYDWLLQQVALADVTPMQTPVAADDALDAIILPLSESNSANDASFFDTHDATQTLTSLWSRIVQEPAVVYRELQDRCRRPTSDAADFAAAYWLLRFYPACDSGQTSVFWLWQGLRREPTAGTLRELFRRHSFWYPDEVVELPIVHWIGEHLTAPLGQQILGQRWDAAGWLQRVDVIHHDLDELRPIHRDRQELWTWILLRALDELLWCETDEAHRILMSVHGELQDIASESLTFLDELNGLDYRLELRRDWQRLRHSQREEALLLYALLQCSEKEDRTGLHYYLVELATRCRANLARTLMMLEPNDTISTLVLDHLESRVSHWMTTIPSLHREVPLEQVTQVVWPAREKLRQRKFRDLRLQIVELSITYGISPRLVIGQLASWNFDQTALHVLQNDAGIFLVWAACMTPLML